MIRNRTPLVLIFIALLAAYGCAGTNQQQQKKIKIGVSVPAADHGWTAGVGYWAQTQINRYPDVDFVYTTANEPGKQTSDIEDMMTQQVAASFYSPPSLTPSHRLQRRRRIAGSFLSVSIVVPIR